jgi:hypothetical protein
MFWIVHRASDPNAATLERTGVMWLNKTIEGYCD